MQRPYVSQELRRLVSTRADYLCEYCLIYEQDTAFGCAIDHIISLKHGGPTDANNLAYACIFCNRFKGSDIGSIIWQTREFTRFYNPRSDRCLVRIDAIDRTRYSIFLWVNHLP